MKAAFLSSSLIASKGKAAPASPRQTPKNLLNDGGKNGENHVSRIYDRVRDYADPHHDQPEAPEENATLDTETTATHSPGPEDSFSDEDYAGRQDVAAPPPQTDSHQSFAEHKYQPVSATKAAMNGSSPETVPSPLGEEQARRIAAEVSKLKKDGLGRIRISVRMAPQDHLQLKLIAAHTQMSAQSIFETALEEYVANHGTKILPQSCNCVLDKSSH